jgi:tetratricopeptide (TPR) repeat protein
MNSNKQQSSNLSREQIHQYSSTRDEQVKHEIEKLALENDFDADALEGWNELSAAGYSLKKLDAKFSKNYSTLIWSIALFVPVIIIGFFLTFQASEKPLQSKIEKEQVNSSIKVEETDLIIPTEIEAFIELPKKEQIAIKTIINDFNEQKNESNETNSNSNNPEDVDRLPVSPIEPTDTKTTTIAKETAFGKEIYLHDMKLLDYRAYRSKPAIETKQMILTGTPANIGETTTIEETTEWKNVDIPYIEYIDKTMEIFSKGNNKKALARFQIILDTYPDDVNANFYAGLCYYNLKEFSSAISSFVKCYDTKFTNFNEEAEWYTAKSYLANGQKAEAKTLFTQIANNNGYYAPQAKKIITSF